MKLANERVAGRSVPPISTSTRVGRLFAHSKAARRRLHCGVPMAPL
jgi:hypothetical protein